MLSRVVPSVLAFVALAALAPERSAAAQDGPPRPRLEGRLPHHLQPRPVASTRAQRLASVGARPTILLTGYWPPTNEAIRRFSTDPAKNPLGWIGSNWENRGYDVHAYFPEFSPPDCTSCGAGTGDLTVDYQDTSADFWPIANALQPIAIITFSRANEQLTWEVEMNQFNFTSWVNDFAAPLQPTPTPPDASVPGGTLRLSMLPMQTIVDDVNAANLGLTPFICMSNNAGSFLSGFMAYHGVWYQSIHAAPDDPARCIAAGHIHVGRGVPWATARRAAEVSLRTVIRHVDATLDPCVAVDLFCSTTQNSAGPGAMLTTSGSGSIAANGLRFLLNSAPPNQVGSLVYSAATGPVVTWGNGLRCLASPFQRLGPILPADANGFLDRTVDFTLPPLASGPFAVTAGSTWNFQYVYRDPAAGGANFDTTNGVSITFCP